MTCKADASRTLCTPMRAPFPTARLLALERPALGTPPPFLPQHAQKRRVLGTPGLSIRPVILKGTRIERKIDRTGSLARP